MERRELPRLLFDALCHATTAIETQIVLNKTRPSESVRKLVAPLAPRFGEGFLEYEDLGSQPKLERGFIITLYALTGVELFSISVSKDGSSIVASSSSNGLDLSLPASQAAAKMLDMATRALHEPEFKMSAQAGKILREFFGDAQEVATRGVEIEFERRTR